MIKAISESPNRNTLWARIFVDELARSGLQSVCIAPGSRSTPLTLAFAEEPRIKVYSHLDERSAAFFGLGLALASGQSVALVCTSGTATANFFPAIIEAYQAQIPLLVLTTDRPPELRESGANQTIDQIKLYGDQVRWFVDVALPEAQPSQTTLRYLRTLAGRALAMANGLPAGPVHLNFPFRKPLEPTAVSGDSSSEAALGRSERIPFTRFSRGVLTPNEEQIESLRTAIEATPQGIIVCGPRSPGGKFPEAVTRLAQKAGYPILADGISGVRFGPHVAQFPKIVLGGYDTFLPSAMKAKALQAKLVLRFGAMPIGKAMGDYLEYLSDSQHMLITGNGIWADAHHQLTDFIWADPELLCRQVAEQLTPTHDFDWLARFQTAEQKSRSIIEATSSDSFSEGEVLAEVVHSLPEGATLYLASSMSVRHLDMFALPEAKSLRVLANRGASGIDGTISSALGAAAATDSPVVLVTGDIAFYHDLNGLLALKRCGVRATIVLIHNDGGGIFQRLPIAQFDPPFTDLFVMPHGLDFEPVVRMFGANYQRTTTRSDFRHALHQAIKSDISEVIELPSDATLFEQKRRQIISKMIQESI